MTTEILESIDYAADGADLWAGIEDVVVIPVMPEDLVPFDQEISNIQVRSEARSVFLGWVRWNLIGATGTAGRMFNDQAVPCSDGATADLFFPEFPDASGYGAGERDLTYRRAVAQTEINMANAKRVCFSECPMRVQCLTRAVGADAPRSNSVQDVDPYSIQGGWGPGALGAIARSFHMTRRSYQRGVQEQVALSTARESKQSEDELSELRAGFKGMNADGIAVTEAEALAWNPYR